MADGSQTIKFCAFSAAQLADQLGLSCPPFARKRNPFRQLRYIRGYLSALGCKTIVEEGHYIDRDHIEDHSAFYSRNFISYENCCRRLHFFCEDEAEVRRKLKELVSSGKDKQSFYREACRDFSRQSYLGSVVIKPLAGCPVGRTILRPYPRQEAGIDHVREFPCIRHHRAHLLGVELTVEGLPFQQQDTGVSACATTAIWCALHHFKGIEEVGSATPAQITNAASKYNLPFGRPMPSEGLSVEQMCQAIQSIGISPHLYRAVNFVTARSIIHSATSSGIASILIIKSEKTQERHAVAVAGIKVRESLALAADKNIADRSAQMVGTYVHDDRWGPYVSTTLEEAGGNARLRVLERGAIEHEEEWTITHILIPMHSKVRLSFVGLQDVAAEIITQIQLFFRVTLKMSTPDVTFSTSILRGHKYVEGLLFGKKDCDPERLVEFTSRVSLPRYVGLVCVENPHFGIIDVLVDTTGTVRNLHCSAVLSRTPEAEHAAAVGGFLAKHFKASQNVFEI